MLQFFVIVFFVIRSVFLINEECNVNGIDGTCQYLSNCPSVINFLQHDGIPNICNVDEVELVVCCLNKRIQERHHGPREHRRRFRLHRPLSNNDPLIYPEESRRHPPFQNEQYFPDDNFNRPHRRPSNDINRPPLYDDNRQQDNIEGELIRFNDITTQSNVEIQKQSPTNLPSTISTTTISSTTISSNENEIPLSLKKCLKYYPYKAFKTFVIGGVKSLPKEYPHMALIGFGDDVNDKHWLCGGSLISKRFILTAAHCLYSSQYGEPKWVHLGDLDLSTDKDNADPQDFTIIRKIPHPDYKPPRKYNDIALLELDKPVKLTPYVSPACLQTTKHLNVTSMIATGWGKTDFAADSSNFLLQVNLDEVDVEKCKPFYEKLEREYLPNSILDESQICAGGVKKKDTCSGDSGGPLQVKNKLLSNPVNVYTVIGITSFGKACGITPSPGVYTRVSYYINWIESIVWARDQD